ncbi:hypothetical protein [Desulfatitalea alkaliphila]|uniref:Uncharacterized protein n=1 Tax=Desulfatitalea alkaliphila TaxID=2929485 RepID=A0AA41R081_9BACT|nr:hypothetical protein [Desulfatitalea alkaliphila]MCJ8499593.1 hypothetical protein [Desulfatitalea alkaliphila]
MAPVYKYAYWADAQTVQHLKAQLAICGMEPHEARKVVCSPLARHIKIGIVVPDTWRKTRLCQRPLSWYWDSPMAGRYLIVSDKGLDGFGLSPQILLRKTGFRAPRLPDRGQQLQLIQRSSYRNAKPAAWDDLSAEDPSQQEKWMRIMGIRGQRFDELFITHCANHANFLEPAYFVESSGEIVPYSIGQTNQVCSACLELFNVIGAAYRRKLVVPCPGAVIYAGLPVNRYIEVETVSDPDERISK